MDILASEVPDEPKKNKRGGESTNSHHANRHKKDLETGGEDFAVLSLGVYWETGYDSFMELLSDGRDTARELHQPFIVGNEEFAMAINPAGLKSGGGKGMYYPYIVQTRGFTIKISEHEKPIDETPNVIVEMGSLLLMSSRGLLNAWADLKNILEGWGGFVLWDKISRLDLCADLPGEKIADINRLIAIKNQFVTRAISDVSYREHLAPRGVTIGTGKIMLRIYDKRYEVMVKKPNPAKRLILEELRWGGPQESALRVEFQLRREALRELGIGTLSDYISNRAKVGNYLTQEWFRLIRQKPDRKNGNSRRVGTHRLWRKVQRAFADWLGESPEVAKRRAAIGKDPIRLVKQAGGCLMSSIVDLTQRVEMHPEEFRGFAHKVLDYYVDDMDYATFFKRYNGKAAKRIVETPSTEVKPRLNGNNVPWVDNTVDASVFWRNRMEGRVKKRREDEEEEESDEESDS